MPTIAPIITHGAEDVKQDGKAYLLDLGDGKGGKKSGDYSAVYRKSAAAHRHHSFKGFDDVVPCRASVGHNVSIKVENKIIKTCAYNSEYLREKV